MMENGQVRENTREQLPRLDLSETQKLTIQRGSALLEAVRDGIVHFVNEARGKTDSTKSVDKVNEAGIAPLHKATQNDQTDSAKSLLDQAGGVQILTYKREKTS